VAETPLQLTNFSTELGAHLIFNQRLLASAADQALNVLGPGVIHLAGPIDNTFGNLQVVGGGLLRLGSTNAYTGQTLLDRGTIEVSADGALGTSNQPTVLRSGTTLALAAGVDYQQVEPVSMGGHGQTGRAGALEVADATSVTFAGPLTVVSSTTIAAPMANSRLRLTSPVQSIATADLTTRGEGEIELVGAVEAIRNLIHSGLGTLRLSNSASTFGSNTAGTTTGTLRIAAGTVVIGADAPAGAPGALGRSTFRVRLGGAGDAGAGGEAALLVDGPFVVGRILQVDADSLGRTVRIGNTGPYLSRFTGPIYLQRELTLSAAAGGTLRMEGAILNEAGTGSLAIDGPGIVELTGANRFTGGTTVSGSLRVSGELVGAVVVAGGSLGGTGRITAPVTIGASARLSLALGASPDTHLPLRIDAALTVQPGTIVALSGNTPEPGTVWTLVRSTTASGPLPTLELPPDWEGQLAWAGGDLRFTAGPVRSAPAIWRELHFGSDTTTGSGALDADPDGDGLPNLLEYALDRSPNSVDAEGAVLMDTSADRLILQFVRVADPDLTYVVEGADSLAEWTAIWSSTGQQNTAGPVTVQDSVPFSSQTFRLLRLRVTINSW
jgi:autotransporter-associated beta strand protein